MENVVRIGEDWSVEKLETYDGRYWICEVWAEDGEAVLRVMTKNGEDLYLKLPADHVDICVTNVTIGRVQIANIVNGNAGLYGFYKVVMEYGKMGEKRLVLSKPI